MKSILTVARKELATYFNSPIAYIVVVFFLAFTSTWFFYIQQFLVQNVASMRSYFGILPVVFVILMPAITMRSWAEENKLGTAEVLLTLPLTEAQIVVGKFLGALGLLALMLVLTLPVPLTISPLAIFATGQIIGQYIGTFLLGAAAISVGLFVSSLSQNQITSFILGVVVLLALTLVNQVNVVINLPRWLGDLLNQLSLNHHFRSFEKGLLDSRDLAYYVLLVFLFLYLNTKVLIIRKWR
ncbi:MAG: ABC transporter permease subunit [Spirochaetes bacterium]|jgi:ABC-2 type transport system permease protein|nr:ABC transporter permease subunit [Spirochaetota bacterium]